MNGHEEARKFSEDLDALLEGREPSAGDPALAAARRLAKADFAADSRIQAGLRDRLLTPAPGLPFFSAPVQAALAAALIVLVVLLPLGRMSDRPVEKPVAPRPAPVMPAAAPEVPAPPRAGYPRGAQGLPVLPGFFPAEPAAGPERFVQSLFIVRRPVGGGSSPFILAEGRPIEQENGSAVLWELGGESFILERRRISLDDVFVTPEL